MSIFDMPRLYAGSEIKGKLVDNCSCLRSQYVPPWWCRWGAFQTIVRQLIKTCPKMPFEREIVELPDGGQVGLDWLEPNADHAMLAPVVLVLPGLTGSTDESYVLHLVKAAASANHRAVVFNNRGNAGVPLLTAQTYSAAYTEDLGNVIRHVRKRYPKSPLLAVGFSLGGMILFNYISKFEKNPDESGLVGGMVISAAWNPFQSTHWLEAFPYRQLFNYRLAQGLCRGLKRHRVLFEGKLDVEHVLRSNLIREFDERFIVPMFGYQDVNEYYEDASMYSKVHKISLPVLCLNAADDCFAPVDSIPLEEVQKSRNVAVVVTSCGGHLGFLKNDRWWPNQGGFVEELFQQFAQIIFSQSRDGLSN